MNYKQKALDHVRNVCPELMELGRGCVIELHHDIGREVIDREYPILDNKITDGPYYNCIDSDRKVNRKVIKKIIGHTPHLEHWLRGIESAWGDLDNVCLRHERLSICINFDDDHWLDYNLTKDGENQSEEFYQAYCEIVGV